MGVYIKDMDMPKEGFVEVLIRDDGTVQQTGQSYRLDGTDYYTPYVGEMPVVYKAVPVPKHGDLVDRDEMRAIAISLLNEAVTDQEADAIREMWSRLGQMPVYIPAEEGEK